MRAARRLRIVREEPVEDFELIGDIATRIINRMQAACARSWMGPRLRLVQDTAKPKHVS